MSDPSLGTLSERETALLMLLAQGHTVKSAAAETGDTVHAASELLRSARRKLGVSSSREAARLITENAGEPHKNGDTKIGIDPGGSQRFRSGYLITGGIMITALALVPALLFFTAADVDASGDAAASAAATPVPTYSDMPKVVETYPAHGARIAPGPFEMRITFDRPMMGQVSIWQPGDEINLVTMECGDVRQSEDLHTFTQSCEAVAGAQHVVFFGHATLPMFRAVNGAEAEPYVLSFTVTHPARR